MLEKEKVNQFWMKKNLVLFGLSRDPKQISREVYDLLVKKGYKIFPINPKVDQIDSITCYKSLDEVKPDLEGAIVITNPKISLEVAKQCHQRGINDLWFQLETMDDDVKAFLINNGMNYIYSCALLHHKEAGFPHSLHRFFYRLFRMK
jgi:predicted CoA-binding protein